MTDRVLALDPGLATFGACVVETDGHRHELLDLFTLVTERDARAARRLGETEDRARRVVEVFDWLRATLDRWSPAYVAAEAAGYGMPSQRAIISMASGWATLACAMRTHRRNMARFVASARTWRVALVGEPGDERDAQMYAARRVKGAMSAITDLPAEQRVHAADAVGVFAWSIKLPEALALVKT